MNLMKYKQEMVKMVTREEAWNLLTEYNKEAFHLEHAEIVELTMKYFARKYEGSAVCRIKIL